MLTMLPGSAVEAAALELEISRKTARVHAETSGWERREAKRQRQRPWKTSTKGAMCSGRLHEVERDFVSREDE